MESIVYAVDWNQGRENVLGGAAWLGGSGAEVIEQLRKPTAMVCSTKGAEKSPLAGGRKKRDDLLIDMIRSAAAKGGTVLIPTDSSSRVLELAYVLEHAWRQAWRKDNRENDNDAALRNAKLYLATRNAGATMTYARSMLEWMDENVVREFENESSNISSQQHKRTSSKQIHDDDRSNGAKPSGPFDFQYLKIVERKSRVEKLLAAKGAQIILASDSSLDWGFSNEVLHRIASDPSNLIILTKEYGSGEAGGIGATLWNWYQERRDGIAMEKGLDGQNLDQVHTGGRELSFQTAQRTPLEGKELLMYQQYLATQRRLQNTVPSGGAQSLETAADALDESSSTSSSSSEDSDPERQGKALNTSAVVAHFNRNKLGATKEILGVNVLLRQRGVYDYDVRGKKGREQMFPFLSKRRRADDFGDLINPDDYLRAEERDDVDGQHVKDSEPGKEARLGQKRKWQDSGLQNGTGRRLSNGSNKRRQVVRDPRSRPATHETNGDTRDDGRKSSDDESLSSDSEPDIDQQEAAVPSRLDISIQSVPTHLRLAFVDYSGIHDQRSLSMLLPIIQPKKLILVGGSSSETSSLADDYRQKLGLQSTPNNTASNFVYTPAVGETVNASVDTNAWTVKLSEALVRRFNWQDVKGMGVVTLVGHLAATTIDEGISQPEPSAKKRQKLLKRDSSGDAAAAAAVSFSPPPSPTLKMAKPQEVTPLLDVLPTSMAAATRSVAQPLHVGDLRLADLRKMLQSAGHTAEFRGEGTLLIDGMVAVRKSGTGRIEVEGGGLGFPDSRTVVTRMREGTFLAVRRRIYEGLAVIAGG